MYFIKLIINYKYIIFIIKKYNLFYQYFYTRDINELIFIFNHQKYLLIGL